MRLPCVVATARCHAPRRLLRLELGSGGIGHGARGELAGFHEDYRALPPPRATTLPPRTTRLRTLMHVKCIHELCIVLLIFQSYLHHIRVISLFYIDFGNISLFPYFSGINPTQAENPSFYILMFQGPKRRPNHLQIYERQYLEGRRPVGEGSEQTEARGPNEGGPRGLVL